MYHESGSLAMFGVLELPFLLIAVYFAFRVAAKLKGGAFGRGMQFLAWGFVVMAVGHLNMQLERYTDVDLFDTIAGETLGGMLWVVALAITWGLSGYGFLQIYRSAKGA